MAIKTYSTYTREPAKANDFLSSNLVVKNPGSNLFSGVGQYKFDLFGNSNVYGFDYRSSTPGKHSYKNVHADKFPGAYNSSSMYYNQDGQKIKKAYLFMAETYYNWSGAKTNRANTFIEGPKDGRIVFDDGGTLLNKYFDITDFIAQEGTGLYYGVNIDTQSSSYANYDIDAGWQIVVIEEDPTFNYRQMSLVGYNTMMQLGSQIIRASKGNEGNLLFHQQATLRDNIFLV